MSLVDFVVHYQKKNVKAKKIKMTKDLEKILNALEIQEKTKVLDFLIDKNYEARKSGKLRLSNDLNNLIFVLQNPSVKPGGVSIEDWEVFKNLVTKLN